MAALDDGLGPDTLLWKFLGDRRFLLTLPRAVSLQMLHPVIARGIREHSRTPRHVWMHARHTVPQLVAMAYADRDLSTVIRYGHENVKGRDDHGNRYHALNPEVFFFQHATYVDTLMTMVDTFIRPLSAAEREQLYQECSIWYHRYGISARAMPASWSEFEEYFAGACAELRVGPDAEYYREQVLRPDAWVVRRVPTPVVRQLLHPRARELYGVPGSGTAALAAYAGWRKILAALGPGHRHVDVAARALRRDRQTVSDAAGVG
ncbi:oxygenase MpaB family protein [Rhodococcus sp. NPDC003318]|uniref:oxygenase MpaB family protein n=1 Tax=Rhodococcus sp. NPDC003318 TaxID=3364503 RepID=UPI0036C00725